MSTERVELDAAFVLHGRAYRETSAIVDLLTREHGRVSLVARGVRRPRSGLRALMQPFQPLLVSWSGRATGLMTLRVAEAAGTGSSLGEAVMSGFYVNELLLRFLHRGDPHPPLFDDYALTVQALAAGEPPERALRRFELTLLAEIGYGLNLEHDAESGEPLDPARAYQYVIERGPVPALTAREAQAGYLGAELAAIARGDFTDPRDVQNARRLLREVLDHHLGDKPLRTREVFAAMRR